MIIRKVNLKDVEHRRELTVKPLESQPQQRRIRQRLQDVNVTEDDVNGLVLSSCRLRFVLAEADFCKSGTYSYIVKPDDFLTTGAVLLRLFENVSCWQCTLNGEDVWQINIQNPTSCGQAALSGVKNSLLDRLFKNKGRAPQNEYGLYLCEAQEDDIKSADKSGFAVNLLADRLFTSAELSGLTLEKAQTDPFVLAAVCAKQSVYLHSGSLPDDTHTPFLHMGLN